MRTLFTSANYSLTPNVWPSYPAPTPNPELQSDFKYTTTLPSNQPPSIDTTVWLQICGHLTKANPKPIHYILTPYIRPPCPGTEHYSPTPIIPPATNTAISKQACYNLTPNRQPPTKESNPKSQNNFSKYFVSRIFMQQSNQEPNILLAYFASQCRPLKKSLTVQKREHLFAKNCT